jgi:hypothetical protein
MVRQPGRTAGRVAHQPSQTPVKTPVTPPPPHPRPGQVRGRLTALIINDIDAGLGHFGNTQITVNNQIVVGTLMNICDNPKQVGR